MTARPSAHSVRPLRPTQRHRNHADNHCQGRHKHGSKAGKPGLDGRLKGVAVFGKPLFGERTIKMLSAVATPIHMIAPINAGTLSVV